MPAPKTVQMKRAILQAENLKELNTVVNQTIDIFSAHRVYNPDLDYNDNAIIADANLHSGFADVMRLAHQRWKVLDERERKQTPELQGELDV